MIFSDISIILFGLTIQITLQNAFFFETHHLKNAFNKSSAPANGEIRPITI
ncbi:MAG: hypothetical protein RIS64_1601 [Bacteroidota bacterium]|jgi:hypothetical protein